MKSRFWGVLLTVPFYLISGRFWGDSLIMKENRIFKEVWAESFTGSPQNSVIGKFA